MLPKDWHRSTLGEIARISSGGTPDRSKPEYWGGDVPWVTTGEIQFNTITDTAEKITSAGLQNSSAKLFPPGTLLMAMYGQGKTRGQVGKLGIEASTNQACAAIMMNEGNDPDFYFQYFSSQYEELRELGNAGTQKNLNGGILKGVMVPVPPDVEQRRIAQILSTWDQAIAATERLLANSEAQKLGLMQGLLAGKYRLDGHTIGWQEHLLGKLFTERVEPNRADLQLLSITREQGVILREDVGRKDTSNEDKSKYLRICPGDIGYNTMRMWQGVSALSQYEGIISPAYTVITPGALIDGQFASFLFKSQAIIFLFYRHSQGLVSDTWNLKFSHFAKIKIKIPSVEEQRRIAEVLEKADQQITVIQRQLSALREEKTALMSQLLTGKRRVNLAEVETETQA